MKYVGRASFLIVVGLSFFGWYDWHQDEEWRSGAISASQSLDHPLLIMAGIFLLEANFTLVLLLLWRAIRDIRSKRSKGSIMTTAS